MREVGFPCATDQPQEVYSSSPIPVLHGVRRCNFFFVALSLLSRFSKKISGRANLWQYHSISNFVKSNINLQILPVFLIVLQAYSAWSKDRLDRSSRIVFGKSLSSVFMKVPICAAINCCSRPYSH